MVNGFHADAVALCHCFIPVLLRHLQPAIRRHFLKMTKSVAGFIDARQAVEFPHN